MNLGQVVRHTREAIVRITLPTEIAEKQTL